MDKTDFKYLSEVSAITTVTAISVATGYHALAMSVLLTWAAIAIWRYSRTADR